MARMGFRRKRFTGAFRRFKPAIRVKNHYETTLIAGAGATTNLTVALAVDDVTNRSTHVQNGGVLKKVVCEVVPQSIVAGKNQCLMWKHLGPVTMSDPIAAYWSSTDPLSEDAVLIRRNLMGRVDTKRVYASSVVPFQMVCKWKGSSLMRDGDAIEISVNNTGSSVTFDVRVWITYII